MTTVHIAKYPLDKTQSDWLKTTIRDVPDFPKPGILFKDITTLVGDPKAFCFVVDSLAEKCEELKADKIAGIEARGFIVGAAVAQNLGIGFIPIRKPGKLPYKSARQEYALEYGTDCLEVHVDATTAGERIVLLDDLLATGGTAGAAIQLIKQVGGNPVGLGFIVELEFLKGREKLPKDLDIFSLISF